MKDFKKLVVLGALVLAFAGCKTPGNVSAPSSTAPEENTSNTTVEQFPPDVHTVRPSWLHITETADPAHNNITLEAMHAYLDPAIFEKDISYDKPYFYVYDAKEEKEIGPSRVSMSVHHLSTVNFAVYNEDGTLDEVQTMNLLVEDFLAGGSLTPIHYYSEMLGGRYVSAAKFQVNAGVGYIYFFAEGENGYSIQFLSYEEFTEPQRKLMSAFFSSIYFSEE